MRQAASRLRVVLALSVVLVPLLLAGATLAHTHAGADHLRLHGRAFMRALGILVSALLVAVTAAPAFAQDAGALRREIEQLRKQLEGLTERLQRLETQPQPQMAAPPPVPPALQSPANPETQMSPPSLTDLARPRQPFSLYQQRGSGQLLFDIGIAGDFVGNLTQHNVQKSGTGTFAGR